jgi:hypothetical protein
VLGFKSGTARRDADDAAEESSSPIDAPVVNASLRASEASARESVARAAAAAKKSLEKESREKAQRGREAKKPETKPAAPERTSAGAERPRRVGGADEQN